jgi:membrane protein DedA with SNARE-associated domain
MPEEDWGNSAIIAPMDIESIVLGFSYAGIFVLMVSNGFFSFPSSQILYILVGYFVSTGFLGLLGASLAGALGNTLGNVLLYEAVRAKGVHYIEKFGIFKREDIARVEIVFRKKGLWFLFIGKLLPAIKVFVPIPAALAKIDRRLFAGIMLGASWIWSLGFIGIGFLFGKSAELWKSYGIVLAIIAFIVLFLFYRLLHSQEVNEEMERKATKK